jgi:hypothetical protein
MDLQTRDQLNDTGPRSAPQTDPTNPYHEESVGNWTRAEEVSVWKVDEPGLVDRDRQERSLLTPLAPASGARGRG